MSTTYDQNIAEMLARESRQRGPQEISYGDPSSNIVKLGSMTMEAFGDNIIVIEDTHKSGLECGRCNHHGSIRCEDCGGDGKNGNKKCTPCEGTGNVQCPECHGVGHIIIIPEDRQSRPTTGLVVSAGEDVHHLKRGQGVIFPSFVGHAFDLNAHDLEGNVVVAVIHIMREREVIAKISGHLEMTKLKRSKAEGTAA